MFAPRTRHAHVPAVERLEDRRLPSALASSNSSYRVNLVRHEYHVFVGDLQRLELRSRTTTAEALALRDDAREIAQDASTTSLGLQAAQTKALAATLQLDHAPLDGWVGDRGWSVIAARLADNLNGLNVPQAVVNRTVTDMRAIAASAGVSASDAQRLDAEMEKLLDGEQSLGPNSYYTFPNPQLYYTQHLREFFRGAPGQQLVAQAKLNSDLHRIATAAGDDRADNALLRRDALLLETVGATLTSDADARFSRTYLNAFAQGAPSTGVVARLPAELHAALGPAASPATVAQADRLAADAATFFRAAGSSTGNAAEIVNDARSLVAAGGAQPLDPFKIQLRRVVPTASNASG